MNMPSPPEKHGASGRSSRCLRENGMAVFITVLCLCVVSGLAGYIVWRSRWGYPSRSVPAVLAYHKVTRFEFGGTWVTPGRFASQIDALVDAGYSFIDETGFLDVLDGTRETAEREVLLTFDDGYRELLDSAIPALEKRGIPALIFLIRGFAGRENGWDLNLPGRRCRHLGWDEVSDLVRRGFTFGSHSVTHRDLTRLSGEELVHELSDSRNEIERRISCEVRSFSYPFGRTNQRIERAAAGAGYRAAFTLCPDRRATDVERYCLRREGVYVIDTVATLKCRLGRRGLFWFEDLKGRAINAVAVLTPILKGE